MSDSDTAVDPLAVDPPTSKDDEKGSELSDEVMQIDSDSRGNTGNDVEVVSSGAEGSSAPETKKSESVTKKQDPVVKEKASGELIEKRPSLSRHLGETPEEIRQRIERQFENNPMQKVTCTVCNSQINHHLKGLVRKHPSLGVIICKRCENYYGAGEFSCDEDGFENYCRWCAQGGNLMCCESCKNGFCTKCIRRNLGRNKLEAVEGTDLWHCFLCDSSQIYELQTRYDVVKVMQEKQLQKEKLKIMKERSKERTSGKFQALKLKREEWQKKMKPVEGEGTKWLDDALETTYYITNMMQDALINLSKKWEKMKKDQTKNHSEEFAKKLLTVTKVTQVNLSKLDQSVQNNIKQLFGTPFTANVGGKSPPKPLPSKAVTISPVPVTRPGPKSAIARRTNLPPGTVIKKVTAAKPPKPPNTVLKVQITKKKKEPEVVDEITIDSDSDPDEGLAPWELMQQIMTTKDEGEASAAQEVEKLENGIVVSKISQNSDSDCEIVIEENSGKAHKKSNKVNGVIRKSKPKARKEVKKGTPTPKKSHGKKENVVDVHSDTDKAKDEHNGTNEEVEAETEAQNRKRTPTNSDDEAKEDDSDKTTCKEESSKKRKRNPSGSDDERDDASKKKMDDKSSNITSEGSEKSKDVDSSQNETTEQPKDDDKKDTEQHCQEMEEPMEKTEKSRVTQNKAKLTGNSTDSRKINGDLNTDKSDKGSESCTKSRKLNKSKPKDVDKEENQSDDDQKKDAKPKKSKVQASNKDLQNEKLNVKDSSKGDGKKEETKVKHSTKDLENEKLNVKDRSKSDGKKDETKVKHSTKDLENEKPNVKDSSKGVGKEDKEIKVKDSTKDLEKSDKKGSPESKKSNKSEVKDVEKSDKKESSKSNESRAKDADTPEKKSSLLNKSNEESPKSEKSGKSKVEDSSLESSDKRESSESRKSNESKAKDIEKSDKKKSPESKKSDVSKAKDIEKSDKKKSPESKKSDVSKAKDSSKYLEKPEKTEGSESKNKDSNKAVSESNKKENSNAESEKSREEKRFDNMKKVRDTKNGDEAKPGKKETSVDSNKTDLEKPKKEKRRNTKTEDESEEKKNSNSESEKLSEAESKSKDSGKDKEETESSVALKKNREIRDKNLGDSENSKRSNLEPKKLNKDKCAPVECLNDETSSLSEDNCEVDNQTVASNQDSSKKSEGEEQISDNEVKETSSSKSNNGALEETVENSIQEDNGSESTQCEGTTKPSLKLKLNLVNCHVENASSSANSSSSNSSDLGLGTDDEEVPVKKTRRQREKKNKRARQSKLKDAKSDSPASDGDGEASEDEEMDAALIKKKKKKLRKLKKRTQLHDSNCVVKLVRMPEFLYYEWMDGESINVNTALQLCVAKQSNDEDDMLKRLNDQLRKLANLSSLKRRRESDSSDTSIHSTTVHKSKKKKPNEEKVPFQFSKIGSDAEDVGSEEDIEEDGRVAEPCRSTLHSDSDDNDDCELLSGSDAESGWASAQKKTKEHSKKPEKDHSEEKETAGEEQDKIEYTSSKRLKDSLLTIHVSDFDDSSEDEKKEAKSKKKVDKEKQGRSSLRIVSDGDSSDDFVTTKKKKAKESDSDKDAITLDSSSDDDEDDDDDDDDEVFHLPKKKRRNAKRKGKKRSSSSNSDSEDSEASKKKKKKRKRIIKASSSEEEESPTKAGRKNIRKLLKKDDLQKETLDATKEEKERKKRIAERQKLYNEMFEVPDLQKEIPSELVLDFDADKKKKLVQVHSDLLSKLKPHQVKGVKFMYDATIESLERMKGDGKSGSGCILAHCMGLGKTLQVITLLQAIMSTRKTKIKHALVVCPLNTVLNWYNEFKIWITDQDMDLYYDEMSGAKDNFYRAEKVRAWREEGGVLIMNYELFRNISNENNKKIKKKQRDIFQEALVDPGADIVICDEGHLLKNENSALSKAMRRIKTLRRVVLTGTPLQNNLKEYHCMIQFVKPNLLGTLKEFTNRFINPIQNGQCADSTDHDVRIMKRRAHILHNMLDGCVQRADYSVLTPFLPPKHEYVIKIRLSDVQRKLYSIYLEKFAAKKIGRGTGLFADYQKLALIWGHPRLLMLADVRDEKKAMFLDDESEAEDSDGSLKNFVVDGSSDSESDKSSNSIISIHDDDESGGEKEAEDKGGKKRRTRADGRPLSPVQAPPAPKWWEDVVTEDLSDNLQLGGKMVLLMEILKACEEVGDKVLVFSQSLLSLNLIETFLRKIDDDTQEYENRPSDKEMEPPAYMGSWSPGLDYFRMDGSTQAHIRKHWCTVFNKEDNLRARLFLISTRAGNMGINLVAANRVIVFDASWNPSHDVQAIFRVYRFGQTKPVYIYRFVAQGTMEEKIYERQVTKQSLSLRVIDEHQIERHFNSRDLNELYTFDPATMDMPRPTPNVPKDLMFAELVNLHEQWIWNYLEHDSLLENKVDEELTEEERKAAWDEYENEKKGRLNPNIDLMRNQMFFNHYNNLMPQWNPNGMIGVSAEDSFLASAREQARQANQRDMMQRIQMFMSAGSSSLGAYNTNMAKILRQTYPNIPESEILKRVQDSNARVSLQNRANSNYGNAFQNQLLAAYGGGLARSNAYRMMAPQQRIAQPSRNTVRGTLASLAAKGINVERSQQNDDIMILPTSSTN